MKPVALLTRKDVQSLRRKPLGTNGSSITVTEQEVLEIHDHLETIYTGKVQFSFAEKIAIKNRVY